MEQKTWLIAGLGNPEPRYAGTRHNAGFEALDALAARWGIPVDRAKWRGLCGQGTVAGCRVVLLKPLTYMNASGESVGPAAAFFQIPPQRVLVLCDDITREPGRLRIRPKGSAGGHNGLKSVIAHLGSEDFPRIRIGIGERPTPEYDLADWVLAKLPPEEKQAIADRYPDIAAAAELILTGRLGDAQSRYNH